MSRRRTPTPRESGTLQRGPVFAALAQGVRDVMMGWEARYLGHGREGLRELDIAHARRCRAMAVRAEELRVFFASWEREDPGGTERLAGVMRLRDLETEAKPYMPTF